MYSIFKQPLHPYTQALLASTPRVDLDGLDIQPIPGQPPNLQRLPTGCAFAERCRFADDTCRSQQPSLQDKNTLTPTPLPHRERG